MTIDIVKYSSSPYRNRADGNSLMRSLSKIPLHRPFDDTARLSRKISPVQTRIPARIVISNDKLMMGLVVSNAYWVDSLTYVLWFSELSRS